MFEIVPCNSFGLTVGGSEIGILGVKQLAAKRKVDLIIDNADGLTATAMCYEDVESFSVYVKIILPISRPIPCFDCLLDHVCSSANGSGGGSSKGMDC